MKHLRIPSLRLMPPKYPSFMEFLVELALICYTFTLGRIIHYLHHIFASTASRNYIRINSYYPREEED